jgi:hypothetical protein
VEFYPPKERTGAASLTGFIKEMARRFFTTVSAIAIADAMVSSVNGGIPDANGNVTVVSLDPSTGN